MSFFSFNKRNIRRGLWLTVMLLLGLYLGFGHKYSFVRTVGTSMEPTYKNKEIIIYENYHSELKLKRFDSVIIRYQKEKLFKRIIGLPGETIEIRSGIFYINGMKLNDPYNNFPANGQGNEMHPITLPKKTYFFIGDNRSDSTRGIFEIKDVIGRAFF